MLTAAGMSVMKEVRHLDPIDQRRPDFLVLDGSLQRFTTRTRTDHTRAYAYALARGGGTPCSCTRAYSATCTAGALQTVGTGSGSCMVVKNGQI